MMVGSIITTLWFIAAFAILYWRLDTAVGFMAEVYSLKINEIGDTFAGFFAPPAFLWVVVATFLQRKELQEQRAVAREQAEELRRNASILERQTQIADRQFSISNIEHRVRILDLELTNLMVVVLSNHWAYSIDSNFGKNYSVEFDNYLGSIKNLRNSFQLENPASFFTFIYLNMIEYDGLDRHDRENRRRALGVALGGGHVVILARAIVQNSFDSIVHKYYDPFELPSSNDIIRTRINALHLYEIQSYLKDAAMAADEINSSM